MTNKPVPRMRKQRPGLPDVVFVFFVRGFLFLVYTGIINLNEKKNTVWDKRSRIFEKGFCNPDRYCFFM